MTTNLTDNINECNKKASPFISEVGVNFSPNKFRGALVSFEIMVILPILPLDVYWCAPSYFSMQPRVVM